MLMQCTRMLCSGIAQKSHSPLTALVVSEATQHGQRGRQSRTDKACLESPNKDRFAAIKAPQSLALQHSNLATRNTVLLDGLNGPSNSEDASGVADPNVFVFGIDPDVSGALAVLHGSIDNTAHAKVFDVPIVRVMIGSGYRKRHDPRSLTTMIKELKAPAGSVAYLEQNSPLPKDGKLGWWGSGFGYGIWIGTLVALGISVIPVPAVAWKRALGLAGKAVTKDDCRALASLMFPSLAPQLIRKKDHGRAEALLIAAYGKGLPVPTNFTLDKESYSEASLCE